MTGNGEREAPEMGVHGRKLLSWPVGCGRGGWTDVGRRLVDYWRPWCEGRGEVTGRRCVGWSLVDDEEERKRRCGRMEMELGLG